MFAERKRMGRKRNDVIGTLDFETDPFRAGRIPLPFACGIFFSRNDYCIVWESDSKNDFLGRIAKALRRLPRCVLYVHNGGRFDFHYLLEYADKGRIEIRNGRVISMRIGKCTLKDSFPLMPFALAEFRKTPINYAIFEKNKRDIPRNRREIVSYLLDDCADLLELVTGFRAIVGEKDTIGAAAFHNMKQLGIKINHESEEHDALFRPYFFGGRVQAFERGIFKGPLLSVDCNSAYAEAMRHEHPNGADYRHGKKLPALAKLGPQFIRCIATSYGALPLRAKDGSLAFPHGVETEYAATGWEIKAGLETNTLQIHKLLDVWTPTETITFRAYIEKFFSLRLKAKLGGDLIAALAYKYLLNSGYGKWAQNPRDFREYCLAPYGKNVPGFDWENDFGALSLWSKPNYREYGFYDVATGGSITGFQRAVFWRGVCSSKGVIYGDTDGLLCRSTSLPLGDKLGQWKREHAADVHVTEARIAGKKLYALKWSRPDKQGNWYKIASKGARLSWGDMLQICRGRSIIWENEAPTFSISGAHFVRRTIKSHEEKEFEFA